MRYGIIGCGRIHRNHVQAIRLLNGIDLVGVSDPDESRLAQATAEWGVPGYKDYRDLVAAGVDAVAICLPHDLHAAICIEMANCGVHVLCEKPIATTLAEADAMVEACARNDVRLGVVFQHRFNRNSQLLKQLITDGELGRLSLGTARFQYWKSPADATYLAWRGKIATAGGGVLANFGIHTLDMLCWLMGPVVAAKGNIATLHLGTEVEDTVAAALQFENGALGTIAATLASPVVFESEVSISGTLGTAVLGDSRELRVERFDHRRDDYRFEGELEVKSFETKLPYGRGHIGVINDFAEAIRDRRPPAVDGMSARETLAVVTMVYESAGRLDPR